MIPPRLVEAAVGLLSEHPVVLIAAAGGLGWLVVGALAAVTLGRMIALAEYEDIAEPTLRIVR